MKTFLKVITVILTIGIVGNLTQGKISPITVILTVVFFYFSWIKDWSKTAKKQERLDELSDIGKQLLDSEECLKLKTSNINKHIHNYIIDTRKALIEEEIGLFQEMANIYTNLEDKTFQINKVLVEEKIRLNKEKSDEYKDLNIMASNLDINLLELELKLEIIKSNFYKSPNYLSSIKPKTDIYSDEQKEAIVCCLYIVASSGGDLGELDIHFIHNVVNFLCYKNFDEMTSITNCFNNRIHIFQTMKELNINQQSMFITWLENLVKRNNEIKKVELLFACSILKHTGLKSDKLFKLSAAFED